MFYVVRQKHNSKPKQAQRSERRMKHNTREAWLNDVARRMAPMFVDLQAPLPEKVRIAIGFTSTGKRGRSIGECWDNRCSADGYYEIFIRPDLAETEDMMPLQIAAILAHELVHAAVGIPAGHGPAFRKVAKGLGLVGKMRSTVPGPAFEAAMARIFKRAGALPHGRLKTGRFRPRGPRTEPAVPDDNSVQTTAPKLQTQRHIKCLCRTCGYTCRTSRKWLDQVGPPHCPLHGAMVVHEDESSASQPH